MLEHRQGLAGTQLISVDGALPVTVEEVVRDGVDLCSQMKRRGLSLLSAFATDAEEERALRLLGANGGGNGSDVGAPADPYRQYVEEQHRTVVDILREFPSCQSVTLEGLLGCLPALPPRYYSVCSSPLHDRQSGPEPHANASGFHLKVAFSVVDYHTPVQSWDTHSGRRIGGLATRHLECVCSPFLGKAEGPASSSLAKPTIRIFPKPSHEFRLPPSASTPLILIGPGTGVAPFLGFLSHRRAQLASLESTQAAERTSEGTWRGGYELEAEDLALSRGDARGLNLAVDFLAQHQVAGDVDLFFGCRHEDHDYLYRKELEWFREQGVLTNLYVAFSRDGTEKKAGGGEEKTYVQTLMRKDAACGKRLVEMVLDKGASVYICGDGTAMGRDVQETIVDLLAGRFCDDDGDKRCRSMEEARVRAVAHVDQMKAAGRFVLDIWS